MDSIPLAATMAGSAIPGDHHVQANAAPRFAVAPARAAAPDGAEARELAHVERRLIAEFSPAVTTEQIRRSLVDAVGQLATARVRQYVPLLVERIARQQLQQLAGHPGLRSAG